MPTPPPPNRNAPDPQRLLPGLPGAPLWWRKIMRVRGVRPILGLWLLLAVVVLAALVLTPARLSPEIPGDEMLGQPAHATIKANRDYDVLDPETTAQKREEAARSVLPVYDYDATSATVLEARIESAFAVGRLAVERWLSDNPAKAARVAAAQGERAHLATASKHKALPEEAELLKALAANKDEFLKALQAVIDDDDYLELARSGFDSTVEHSAVRLAGLVSPGFAVAERELLNADRERGINVRIVSGDARGPSAWGSAEKQVRDIDRIRDLAQVQAEVDKLAPDQLADLTQPLRKAVSQVVRRSLKPNLAYDDSETRRRIEEKRASVRDVILQIKKGERIVGDGEVITKQHLLAFRALREAGKSAGAEQVRWGSALFAALVCAALFEFGRRNVRKFNLRSRDVLLLSAILVVQLLVVRGSLSGVDRLHDLIRDTFGVREQQGPALSEFLAALIPVAAGSMIIRYLLFSEAALIWTGAFAPLCGVLAGSGLQPAVAALVIGVVAADRVGHAGSKSAVFRAGLYTAAAQMALVFSFALIQAHAFTPETAAGMAGAFVGGALITPLLVLILAPLCEAIFGVVTDSRLISLASFNHPALKDLIVQAPGTYHHSIVLGAIVDAAARDIGANPLLARVGAYYHDLGKGKNPLYFGENQKAENRHDALAPFSSAELIKRHVADGVQMAVQARLPAVVIDFISQHHGTRLIGYFFHKAKADAERTGQPPPNESDYRYVGPKPQSRETALVMIGDMVVATARGAAEGTDPAQAADKLGALVDHAIATVVQDDQLDECDLTMRDLANIRAAFIRTLISIHIGGLSSPPPELRASAPSLRVLQTAPSVGEPISRLSDPSVIALSDRRNNKLP
jgi:putative nucleotidyltransferase with HDIG domain